MKQIELDTGIEIAGFDKKEIKEILKTEKKFKIDIPCVSSRDLLTITVKIKKKKLLLKVYCSGLDSDHSDQNNEFECKNSAKDLENELYELLRNQYN